MKNIFKILVFLLLISRVFPQVFSGTTTAQFLKIEAGARSIAMGGAFVAVANDASALYWNPAGASKLGRSAVTFTHTKWLADTDYNYAGVILKIGDAQAFGFHYSSLSMPDMKVRNEFYQDGTGEFFSAQDYSLGLTYAFNVTQDFSMGFTGKIVNQSIWNMTASAIVFDAGLHYQTPVQGLSLGMSVANVGGKMKFEGKDNFIYYDFDPNQRGTNDRIFAEIKMDEWDLPLMFRVGLAMQMFDNDLHSLTVSADALHPNDYSESVNTGFEYGFKDRLFLRAGYKSLFKLESEEGLTAGAGLIYYLTDFIPMRVDYGYADFGRLNAVHRFTIEIRF